MRLIDADALTRELACKLHGCDPTEKDGARKAWAIRKCMAELRAAPTVTGKACGDRVAIMELPAPEEKPRGESGGVSHVSEELSGKTPDELHAMLDAAGRKIDEWGPIAREIGRRCAMDIQDKQNEQIISAQLQMTERWLSAAVPEG